MHIKALRSHAFIDSVIIKCQPQEERPAWHRPKTGKDKRHKTQGNRDANELGREIRENSPVRKKMTSKLTCDCNLA